MIRLKSSHFRAMLAGNNYSCESFAKKVNVSKSYVSYMQCGKRQPSHKLARSMMKVLGCEWNELFEEVE